MQAFFYVQAFFKRDPLVLEEAPHRAIARRCPTLGQLSHHRAQGQIRFLGEPRQEKLMHKAVDFDGTDGLHDSPLEEGVSCELVSGNPDFDVRKKQNRRPKAKFDQYLAAV